MILEVSRLALRTFIALDIDPQTVTYLDDTVKILRKSDCQASWTKKDNFHLTLKFLGDTNETIIPQIISELANIFGEFPIPFRPTHIGGFPNLKNPRVLWLGLECEGIEEIAKRGFEKDDKQFVSHLTLGRIKSVHDFSKTIQELPQPPKEGFFTRVVFYKSQLTQSGSIYTPLWTKEQNV
jgi:2'-5' RNA ligase